MLLKICLLIIFFIFLNHLAKSQIADFEELNITTDTFWNGSDNSGGFYLLNNKIFLHNYFADFGGGVTYWDGFSFSNMTNDSVQDYTNQYSCYAGNQLSGHGIFGISCNSLDYTSYENIPTEISFIQPALINSIDVTNSTYTALTIKNGDSFSKKFGGTSGNDPDWFKLQIKGYYDSNETGTIEYYLADFRFINNQFDYIVKNWSNINLSSLGYINKLKFILSSSDTGQYGMNTPSMFCLDNILLIFSLGLPNHTYSKIITYPNPVVDKLYFSEEINQTQIYSIDERLVLSKYGKFNDIDLNNLNPGCYYVLLNNRKEISYIKVIKK
jgi:hypothetical protein